MSRHRCWNPLPRRAERPSAVPRPFRRAGLELLEQRLTLSTAPTLAPIDDVIVQSGAPLHLALDGFDADGDALTFSAEVAGSDDLTAFIPENNRSLRITVAAFEQFAGGDMLFELFEGRAPQTTGRIAELAEWGYYDGLIFHRVIRDFMIQGGSSDGFGYEGTGFTFDDEFHPDLQHTSERLLSMAKGGDDTNDAQFFITSIPTRWLDFNHSVFGYLTEGDDVRQAIAAAETDGTDRPLDDVVIESATVELDEENGVLMLSAPEGTSGQADVTVTVSDGTGTFQQTFHVLYTPDISNADPFLLPIDDIHTTGGVPASFTIPALDIEGDAIYYAGESLDPGWPLSVETSPFDGLTTVTPDEGVVGVFGILVSVAGSDWDEQAVPVFVHPDAPADLELLAGSDTGLSGDGVTGLNNSPGNELSFHVGGLIPGAVVQLFADGQLIGSATAMGESMALVTGGDFTLADGSHSITARQVLPEQEVAIGNRFELVNLQSVHSAAVDVAIDTTAPEFTSQPVLGAAEGVDYAYDVQTDDELGGVQVEYRLTDAPAGMAIDAVSGLIGWTPSAAVGTPQTVVVEATDPAGNTAGQAFSIDVNELPELDTIGDWQVDELSLLAFDVTGADENEPLTFSLDPGAPAGAEIVKIDNNQATFCFTPTEAQGPGLYPVTIRVTDVTGLSTAETIQITVGEVNTPPVLDPIADRTVTEGDLVDLLLGIGDVDLPADELTVTLDDGAPADAVVFQDGTNWRFSWQTGEADGGSFPIKILVGDSSETVEQTFTVNVQEIDSPPVIETPLPQVVAQGDDVELTVRATDTDWPANTQFTFTLEGDVPDGVELTAAGPDSATLTWSVPNDFPMGTVDLTVKATEIGPNGEPGAASVATVTITVFDFQALLFDAVLGEATTAFDPIVPGGESAEMLLLAVEGEPNVAPPGLDSPPVAGTPTAASEMTGIFGTQLAPETGTSSGGEAAPVDEFEPGDFDVPSGGAPDELIVPTSAEEPVVPDTSETSAATPPPEPPEPIDPAAADAAMLAMAEAEASAE